MFYMFLKSPRILYLFKNSLVTLTHSWNFILLIIFLSRIGPQRNSFTKVRVSMVFMRSTHPQTPPVHLLSLVNVLPLIVGIPDWDIQPSKSCLGFSPNLVFQLLGTIMGICLVLPISLQKANS
jgi:hypothetical protein